MRVLVAEDDVTSRLLLQRVLANWGYEVTAVEDGAKAWQALQVDDAPRLAVLDWMMPGMDGVDVCRRVRARKTQQPPYIILLTALGEKDSVVAGLDAGANDYVSKPYDPDELRARVEVGRRFVDLNEQLAEARRALEIQARTDALTGVLNRGAILLELEREAVRAAREGRPLGLGMLDIDRFKLVNDAHGHVAGDSVLREVVRRAVSVLRSYDRFGRFGGEEFLLIVPGAGDAELREILDRVHGAVRATPVAVDGAELAVTVSLGGVARRGESSDGLIALADSALYAAKRQGRDRVVLAPATGEDL
jgi:two-component system, cell cycle response regulator